MRTSRVGRVEVSVRRRRDGAADGRRLRMLTIILPVLLAATAAVGVGTTRLASVAAAQQPAEAGAASAKLSSASTLLAKAIGAGGTGVSFFAVQRTTEYQRPGGAPIAVVDPADDRKVVGQTDHLFVNAMMSRGVIRPDGFFMEMRLGSESSASPADFDAAPPVFSVLVRDGTAWRNDGAGWYRTTELPGMGIDFASALGLPRALGRLGSLASAGTATVNGASTAVWSATLAAADYPGAVAADGLPFTDPSVAVKVWTDGKDRPVQLWLRARNTAHPTWDLVAETTITLDLSASAALPSPDPVAAPEPSALPEPSVTTAP